MLLENGSVVIIAGSAHSRACALCLAHHEGVGMVFTIGVRTGAAEGSYAASATFFEPID